MSTTVSKYGGVVTTVSPATSTLQVALKTGTNVSVSVYTTDTVWRWPEAGDQVMVRQENGSWILDGWFLDSGQFQTIQDVNPGDAVITSPTGVVHVQGSSDGSTDWTLTKPTKPPFTRLTALYAANWTDYDSARSFEWGGYTVSADGWCTLRGLIKKTTTYAYNETIATLPVHPASDEVFEKLGFDSVMGQSIFRVDITPTGVVNLQVGVPQYSTPAQMGWLSLSGIRFLVA